MKNKIEIHYEEFDNEDHFRSMHKPTPARDSLPEWFKNLKTSWDNKTVKSCKGVYDAMTAGFMVYWTKDVTITKNENGRFSISSTRNQNDRVDFHPHPHSQMGLMPLGLLSFQEHGVDKFLTKYRIKTDPGTSILVLQPMYRPELKTEVMPGIIDSDKFYGEYNILFIVKQLDTAKEIKIKAGTPFAQIFPFVRSEWDMSYGPVNKKRAKTNDDNLENLDSFYKKHLWTRKKFTQGETK